ncbi:tetratricopeptide repeat protein [Streptomyces sp. B1866]|uniref:tetratricopeptide repeat protein n=1 Tax=Streptomyces sp. B1866 TaxID=3075431 RepID=UPI00288F90A7|nr:tetratricopeptide repeat protein [Streptomyces sp. B1866]MDT3395613.1 tetratricopeptide repeat protein [Streptomyces sp. B1866]
MAERQPNVALERLLREAGLSEDQFARLVNKVGTECGRRLKYNQSAVSHWVRRGTVPQERARPVILEALMRRLDRPITHAEAGFPPAESEPNGGTDTVEELADLGRLDVDPARRSVLDVGLYAATLAVPGWDDAPARMTAIKTGHSKRVGFSDVAYVRATTDHYSEMDYREGGRHARPQAAAFLINTAVPLLRADATEPVRKAMLSAVSDFCYLLGYMAFDEGANGLAQRYYVKALELAKTAGDNLSYVATLCLMSTQAIHLGHSATALRLTHAAEGVASQVDTSTRAYLAVHKARAVAEAGNGSEARALLGTAEKLMGRVQPDEESVLGLFGPDALTKFTSHVQESLGDLEKSVRAMENSLNRIPASRVRRLVLDGGRLAERQCTIGHLEKACATWGKVLNNYPDVHSGRCDERIQEMISLVNRYKKNPAAGALYERAREELPPKFWTPNKKTSARRTPSRR